jgi:hypothetical protein
MPQGSRPKESELSMRSFEFSLFVGDESAMRAWLIGSFLAIILIGTGCSKKPAATLPAVPSNSTSDSNGEKKSKPPRWESDPSIPAPPP